MRHSSKVTEQQRKRKKSFGQFMQTNQFTYKGNKIDVSSYFYTSALSQIKMESYAELPKKM